MKTAFSETKMRNKMIGAFLDRVPYDRHEINHNSCRFSVILNSFNFNLCHDTPVKKRRNPN